MGKVLKQSELLLSYKEDILKMGAGDWLSSHISFMLPIHKYKGTISLSDQELTISYGNGNIKITKDQVIDINYGFDEVFHPGRDRSRGLSFKPLRISLSDGKTLYLITDFNRLTRGSANRSWFEILSNWITNPNS